MGFAIRAAQDGGMHADAKPWKGERSVYEIVEDHDSDTFRAVYTVCFEDVVYVLHAFQKKSPTGIKTSEPDKRLVKSRLAAAKVDYEETRRKKRD